MALTNRTIASAKPGDTLHDETVTGLHLRCFPNRKSFYLYFRTKDGRERRPKLGDLGILTLDQARRTAKEMLAEVVAGRDPVAARSEARSAPTVADLADRYIKEYATRKKARSRAEDERMIKVYIKPRAIAAKRVRDVQYEDIAAEHARLESTPYQANRLLALLSKMFNLAEKWRLRDPFSNPCRHVTRFKEAKRQRYMKPAEAPKVAEVLAKYEETCPQAVAFVYLLILSGARPSEIASARHDWIERKPLGGVLHLPDSKTGAKTVYLPPQVMTLLERLPKTATGTLTGIRSPKALWELVRKEAETDLRLYDLRHTFASAALKAGYSLDQIGELLGHRSAQTTKRYAHLIDEAGQEAAATTATVIERMLRSALNSLDGPHSAKAEQPAEHGDEGAHIGGG